MHDQVEIIYRLWPLVVFFGAAFVWLIRLESKILYLEKDFAKNQDAFKENIREINSKFNAMNLQLVEIKLSLARIEEKLLHCDEYICATNKRSKGD